MKPPSWQEVQDLARRMPVTFDERGVKEVMTVKMNRWQSFVDSQREKLEKEIRVMQDAKEAERSQQDDKNTASAQKPHTSLVQEPEQEQEPLDDDIAELQRMVDRM